MLKAIKIRLYPTKVQVQQLAELLGVCRVVYNECLHVKKNAYENDKQSLSFCDMSKYFHGVMCKDEKRPWIKLQNTKVLKQSIRHMFTAYDNFFKLHRGYPRFKSKHDREQKCLFPVEAISKRNSYTDNRITLANIKRIKFKTSDKYINQLSTYKSGIKSATLTKTCSGRYYLSILIDMDIVIRERKSKSVGIDLGIKSFVVTSDDVVFDNIKIKRSNQKRLSKLQRSLSRKVKGSNNRNKQRIKLALFHEKLTNIKRNYLHYVSNILINENQVICMEDLNVKGMMKNHCLANSIQELSLSEFRNMLEYKAKLYDRQLITVDRYFPSSKLCSSCGYKNTELSLNNRHWTCPVCAARLDRDLNAALNILAEGRRISKSA